ncbi:MAG TPA: hypothetical protein P5175_01160 [Anaerohalosphaeraceae bacterium]|nr:hypothetical protein [Phycisphaerae bacterium]HOK94852.1 hypothetical protein [Anaerohalosphaeraceae bacterium]HRS70434.1 hypothetical protein [Anaerohalosphaeraceae bacterium]HRV20326.1 hypothetical protein [Anaerohalosphaeraceae bacterium]
MPQNSLSAAASPPSQVPPTAAASHSLEASAASRPTLAQRLSADPSVCISTPAVSSKRPMPLPKSAVPSAPKGSGGFSSQVKKAVFGSAKGQVDSRQKKMAVLVGILSVVFAAVLYVTLGGLGKGKAIAAVSSPDPEQSVPALQKTIEDWKRPDPVPNDLRDATVPVVRQAVPVQTADTDAEVGDLTVRGILFSQHKPSAIVNGQVVTEGQTINGVTVVRISRDTVEFEANGKRWTRSVQR